MYDAHLHLQDERFDTCRDAVIAAAVAAGVTDACCCGSAPGDWEAVERMRSAECGMRSAECGMRSAECGMRSGECGMRSGECGMRSAGCGVRNVDNQSPDSVTSTLRTPHSALCILPAFGVHPWYAGNLAAGWLAQLEEFLVRHPDAPVGEIGMDGLRDDPPRENQQQVLCAQLELAVRLNRPVVLHGARAWGELLTVMKPYALRLPGFVAHAFGGSDDILRAIMAMGGFVSFAGSVCNPAAKRVRAAAAAAPMDRLLIETDAPDMLPLGAGSSPASPRGAGIPDTCAGAGGGPALLTINHPANLVYITRAVAELRGVSVEEIDVLTTVNARRVYGVR